MLGESKKFSYFYGLLRLFGFFPYSWKIGEKNSSSGSGNLLLTKSSCWSVYSLVITIFVVFLMTFDAVICFLEPRDASFGFQTMFILHTFYEILTSLTVASLQVVFWCQSDDLTNFVNYYSKQNMNMKLAPSTTIYTLLMLFVLAPATSVILVINMKLTTSSMLFLVSTKTVLSLYYIIFVGAVYQKNIQYINQQVIDTFESCLIAYQDHKLQCTENEESSDISVMYETSFEDPSTESESFLTNQALPQSAMSRPSLSASTNPKRSTFSGVSQSSETRKVSPRSMLTPEWASRRSSAIRPSYKQNIYKFDFSKIEEKILEAYEFQRIVNKYIDKPMVISMFCLLIWLVVGIFYCTLWRQMDIMGRSLSVLFLLTSLVPVVYLPNSSNCLAEKVWHSHLNRNNIMI